MTLLEFVISKGFEEKIASSLIKSGKVFVNTNAETLINFKIKDHHTIEIKSKGKWVSRGAYKLLEAIKTFNMDLKDQVILDIGSSTGGFTQVALENNAKKVYANDVGTNQLDYSLRSNTKVNVMEKTNLKTLTKNSFEEKINIAVCDVSFISIERVFDVLENILEKDCLFMGLIKPQYQASSELVETGGIVKKIHHNSIINNVKTYADTKGFDFIGVKESPIKGKISKNIEYISLFKRR